MPITFKELEKDLEHSERRRKHLSALVKSMQIDKARAKWHLVEAECRMQDVRVLLDAALNNGDPDQISNQLMYKAEITDHEWEEILKCYST